jgi:hypothetical protein
MALEYPSYQDKVIFMDILAEGANVGEPANQVQLDAWIEDRQIPFTTAIDLPGEGAQTLESFSDIENTYIVELQTRNIVDQAQDPFSLYPFLDAL